MQDLSPGLHLSHDGHCATITLHRPRNRNRLQREDLVALMGHLRTIESNPAIRLLVLTAEVTNENPVFCAGYNIGEHGQEDPEATFEMVADALESLHPVTICGLNGSVYGGATDLVLSCDFTVGVQGMSARMPAAALGLHYYPGGLIRFVTRLGLVNAKRAFLCAETFDDAELLRIGFVQELVSMQNHAETVQARVAALLNLAPLALQSLKRSLNEVARGQFDTEQLRERMVMTQNSSDFQEACRAFLEKRTPVFTGT